MNYLEKLKTPLPPTQKWSNFFILFVYFTILICLYQYSNLVSIFNTIPLSEINDKFIFSYMNIYAIALCTFFNLVLSFSIEYSAAWAFLLGEALLIVGGFILKGDSVMFIAMAGWWLIILLSGAGLVLRFIIQKLDFKVLAAIATIILIIRTALLISQITAHL